MPLSSGPTWTVLALVGGGLVAAASGAWSARGAVQGVVEQRIEQRVAPVERRLDETSKDLAKLATDVAVIRAIVEREAAFLTRLRLPAASAASPSTTP